MSPVRPAKGSLPAFAAATTASAAARSRSGVERPQLEASAVDVLHAIDGKQHLGA